MNNSFFILRRDSLTLDDTNEMFQILERHFDQVTKEHFIDDLNEKNWVILIRQGSLLVGFSTMLVYESMFQGQIVSIVYSGDTIINPEAWGTTALARGWITAVNQIRSNYPHGKYYWLLLTSGFRTYRFLPVFWKNFFPCHSEPIPDYLLGLRHKLATEQFGNQYDPISGIVRFQHPQRLRGKLKEVPSGRTQNSHIACFLKHNPGHVDGDELVCITELSSTNLTSAGRRMISAFNL
jgi:hypothetical protein